MPGLAPPRAQLRWTQMNGMSSTRVTQNIRRHTYCRESDATTSRIFARRMFAASSLTFQSSASMAPASSLSCVGQGCTDMPAISDADTEALLTR